MRIDTFLLSFFSIQFAHYKEEMFLQAQRAFSVSPDRHYRLLHAAAEEKPKIIVMSVVVQEADGLEAKDANGEFYFWIYILKCGVSSKNYEICS